MSYEMSISTTVTKSVQKFIRAPNTTKFQFKNDDKI
jgi:hypothetical protein